MNLSKSLLFKPRLRTSIGWFRVACEVLLLVIVLLSPLISPRFSPWIAVLSFSVPFLPLWLLGRSIYQYLRKDGFFPVFVTLLLITLVAYGPRLFAINVKQPQSDRLLKVMNFNLSAFKANGTADNEANSARFLDFIQKEQIDVLCFQEFSFVTRNLTEPLSELGYDMVQFRNPENEKIRLRTIVFSRHKIQESELILFDNQPAGVYARINFNGEDVGFVSTHIRSYAVKASHPLNSSTFSKVLNAVRYILHRLKVNSVRQIEQMEAILTQTARDSNIIIGGDLNSIPTNYLYTLMRREHSNLFVEAGNGFGVTYLGRTLFFLRIDHQFYRGDKLKAVEVNTLDFGFSDHRAVYGKYEIQ